MFTVRPRKQWRAAAPTSVTSQHPSQIHTLVVHHTAGGAKRTLLAAKRELRNIQRQHMDAQGWSDIGYNFIIDRWGRVWEGRGLFRVGAHTAGQNTNTIGVSFMGNYENLRLNARQIRAYEALVKRLHERGVRFEQVKGHNQMPDQATACPGKNITRQLGL